MSELKIVTKSVNTVDYADLNDFIAETYDLDYFEGTLESPNDSVHEFSVKKEELDEYERDQLARAIEGGGIEYYFLGVVLTDLANKRLIPEGNYLVDVCW